MNEEPKGVWKRFWLGRTGIIIWYAMLSAAAFLTIACVIQILDKITSVPQETVPFQIIPLCVEALVVLVILFIRWFCRNRNVRRFLLCLAGLVALIALIGSVSDLLPKPKIVAIFFIGVAVLTALALPFLRLGRWLCCWHNFRRLLFGVACLATLIALAYVEENVRGKWAWEKFKREWEAKGERFDPASAIPSPVPDDQNFALMPIVASSYAMYLDKDGHELRPPNTNVVDRLTMSTTHNYYGWPTNVVMGNWQKLRLTDLKGWQQYYRALAEKTNVFPVPPQPQSPAADVLLALSKYNLVIEELRQASRLPFSRFPLSYDNEDLSTILFPHFKALKGCAIVLDLRTRAELQNERSDKALEDIKLLLRLNDSLRAEPFLMSHLVRMAMAAIAIEPVWEGLAEHRWSDAQLAGLDRELGKLDFLKDYEREMRSEMALRVAKVDYLRRHRRALANRTVEDDSSPPLPVRVLCHLIPSGWFYQNQLRFARLIVHHFLPAVDLNRGVMSPVFIKDAYAKIEADAKQLNPYVTAQASLLRDIGPGARKFARIQGIVDLARAACALERYRLAHGEYPASLDVLAPQFITKLPHDIISGQPLKYRRSDDGQIVLYSIGWNEKDDGGQVELTESGRVDMDKGDWVWRYPAK